jgi:hypothetical protein
MKLFYSCPSKRQLDIADEESGVETALRFDMARFKFIAWTDAPCSYGSPGLLFANDDNDLLIPHEAMIPEEVSLLEFNAIVHVLRLEDMMPSVYWPSAGDAQGNDSGCGSGTGGGMGGGTRVSSIGSTSGIVYTDAES